uniref:alpha-L-fucosidase n=1 Tax=Acrobeloides nanus TaxID=290746 RepID=A0A914CXE9_9BILA
MWPSKASWNWNSVDIGPHRDIVGELKAGIEKKGIHFGVYFSLFEWFNPLFINDGKENRTDYVDQVSYPQLLELVNNYKPDLIWSDGDWDKSDTYWRSKEFLAWLYNESPIKDKIVVNDRWGNGVMGKHGGFLTYSDHYDPGRLLPRKWENCMTLDKNSWGYRRDMIVADIHTVKELIEQLARTISCGGNLLLNVGPDDYGKIVPIFEERLTDLGKFVNTHNEAIFGTKPWIFQTDFGDIWYTSRLRNSRGFSSKRIFNPQQVQNTVIYAWVLTWPEDGHVKLSSVKPTSKTQVTLLGTNIKLPIQRGAKGIVVDTSGVSWRQFPSLDVFVLKVEYAATLSINPLAGYNMTNSND